jgi:hydrogenase maturation protease
VEPRDEPRRTLILGIGNLLMGDEGIGVHVARRLQDRGTDPGVDVVDGGTGGFQLLEYFEGYERLIVVDAAADGQAPGTLRVIHPRYSSDFPPTLTAHDVGLKSLLDAAELIGRKPKLLLVTISVEPPDEVDLELTPAVRAALEPALETVLRLVADPHALATPE